MKPPASSSWWSMRRGATFKIPAVLAYLAEAAKTWRKKNAALIVATQSAVDVTGTPGR